MQSNEIGLKLDGRLPPFPLGMGTTEDTFQSLGITPALIDMLKRIVTLETAVDLSILAEME